MQNAAESRTARSGTRRFLIGSGILLLLLAGVGYAWTFTPSYSLYRIRQALNAHDYATFSHYVDIDSVLDHGLDEFAGQKDQSADEPTPRSPLGKILRKGLLKNFASEARDILKAGLEIAVEQAVKSQERPLPEIPPLAVVAALWYRRADDDTVRFPIKIKKGQQIEVRARQTPAGLWRVVEINNLPALLPALKSRRAHNSAENGEGRALLLLTTHAVR
jgi:hypothetical protein